MSNENKKNKDKKISSNDSLTKIGDVVDIWKLIKEKGMKLADEKDIDRKLKS